MANHVYFNIEINGLTDEQHDKLFKSETMTRPHWMEGEPDIEFQDLVAIENQPFMANVEKSFDADGYLEDSYNWYCREVGAKWCNIEEWENYSITGYSAWSTPYQMVIHMLEWASKEFDIPLEASMTYEDEFRNFIGKDFFETYKEDDEYYCSHDENYIDSSDIGDKMREIFGEKFDDEDFWEGQHEEGDPSEVQDDIVYTFFETGEWVWAN